MDIKNTTAPCICGHYPVSDKLLKISENFARLQARTWLSCALSSSFTIMVMSLWPTFWRNMYMHTHYMHQRFVQITWPRYFSRIDISL